MRNNFGITFSALKIVRIFIKKKECTSSSMRKSTMKACLRRYDLENIH